ncbi:MAG: hypothetical protein ACOC49_02530 [Candidatus Bipolaricaulota bacterium]
MWWKITIFGLIAVIVLGTTLVYLDKRSFDGKVEKEGLRIPVKGEGVWELDSGSFTYIELQLTKLEYTVPEVY